MLVSSLVVVIVGERLVGGSGVVFRFLTTSTNLFGAQNYQIHGLS